MPSRVNNSSRIACGTRPSMMWAFEVPLSSARSDDSILGSIPPSITAAAMSRSASFRFSVLIRRASLSRMPWTSVRWMSFSAPSAAAISPATRSALMLYVSPPAPTPTGAMTGTNPASSSNRIGSVFTASISPPRPMSTSSPVGSRCGRRRARSSPASFPESPTALPPRWLIRPTMALLILPTRTISTISTVSSSVTRMPPTKRGSLPSRFMRAPTCGAPPRTMTGRMPTKRSRITSSAKGSLRSARSMAAPPYLMTTVLPRNSRMYGSASRSTSTRLGSVVTDSPRLRLRLVLPSSQDVPRQVLVTGDVAEASPHVAGVDGQLLARHLRGVEGDLLQEPLHDRVEPPCPDVLRARVHLHRNVRDRLHRIRRELESHLLRPQQLRVLLEQRVLRFRQDADEILARQGAG